MLEDINEPFISMAFINEKYLIAGRLDKIISLFYLAMTEWSNELATPINLHWQKYITSHTNTYIPIFFEWIILIISFYSVKDVQ